jgi:hypothetical protein
LAIPKGNDVDSDRNTFVTNCRDSFESSSKIILKIFYSMQIISVYHLNLIYIIRKWKSISYFCPWNNCYLVFVYYLLLMLSDHDRRCEDFFQSIPSSSIILSICALSVLVMMYPMLLVVLLMRKKQLDLPTKSTKMKRRRNKKMCLLSVSLSSYPNGTHQWWWWWSLQSV